MKIKKIVLIVLWMLMCQASLFSQEKIKIWGGLHPTRARAWIYRPEGLSNHTAVIICPGGSYHHLGIYHEGHDVADELIKHGFTAVVLRYRTGMYCYHYPAMMEDLQQIMTIVKERANELEIDKIGLIGFSAGGHLVGWMAENYHSPRPDFVVMAYPVVSMEDDIVHKYSRKNLLTPVYSHRLKEQMSLEKNVHKWMPPVFIFCCKDDNVVNPENSFRMRDSLLAHNMPVTSLIMETGGHGFGYMPEKQPSLIWMKAFLEWYDELFRK